MDEDINLERIFQEFSSGSSDVETDLPLISSAEEMFGLQDYNNPSCYSGSFDIEQDYGMSIINQSNNDRIVYDFVQNENCPKVFQYSKISYYKGMPFDKILNKVMYYDGQKISMKTKIKIFNLALKKINEVEGNSQNPLKRLSRIDTRRLNLLNSRLSEIIDFIYFKVQSGDKDFLNIINKLQSKKKKN